MNHINKIRDTIETAIEISKDSGVPMLLISNPGLAKSTIVGNWAKRNNYHLETLIGSRFTQEEILGFQVRTEDKKTAEQHLELLEPFWFRNIIEKDKLNIHSLLFLDELSTVQENVQGAMLQLIFARTIGHNKQVPDSTLIIAAANYKQNIPVFFNIMAPILNRFCIVNLQYESNNAFFDEFLQDENDRNAELFCFKNNSIDSSIKEKLRNNFKTMFKTIFDSFKQIDNDDYMQPLFINNQVYNNIYEGDNAYVYNFISGRTLYYLYQITVSFLRKGITIEKHAKIMLNMVFGLIGLGTNSFNELQQKAYLKLLDKLYLEIYAAYSVSSNSKRQHLGGWVAMKNDDQNGTMLDFKNTAVSQCIDNWLVFSDANIFGGKDCSLADLILHIKNEYPIKGEKFLEKVKSINFSKDNRAVLLNDYDKISLLINVLNDPESDADNTSAIETLNNILVKYKTEKNNAASDFWQEPPDLD
ncbi:MAG: hypothetical protein Ta2B_04590 [Termitinemataceae bacterium]|nr:MAG: hypothetical protein Ta2B_04590 [Termitinemataceae bacterium]